jgi:hypothetical protein
MRFWCEMVPSHALVRLTPLSPALGNGKVSAGIVLWVLYPSGTLFLTRMLTLSSEDCVSADSGGDKGEI